MAKTRAAREAARRKRQRNSPARHLSAVWKEAMINRFGLRVFVSPWGGKDMNLIKKLIDQIGSEKAEEVIKLFISTWKNETDFPTVGLMWHLREKLVNRVDGVVESSGSKIEKGEHDEAVAAEDPDEGWGDGFDDESDSEPESSPKPDPELEEEPDLEPSSEAKARAKAADDEVAKEAAAKAAAEAAASKKPSRRRRSKKK